MPVEASLNATTNGEQPEDEAAVKAAVGACANAMSDSTAHSRVRMVGLHFNLHKFLFAGANIFRWWNPAHRFSKYCS